MSIKGKQILDSTITQSKLDLVNPIALQDAATKDYVDNTKSVEYNSIADKDIPALLTTTNGDLASNQDVSVQPVSGTGVDVYVNGIKIPVGAASADYAYFSPDGLYKRITGNERVEDLLYWNGNTTPYQLDILDELDFVYLISNKIDRVVELQADDTYTYDPFIYKNIFTFFGDPGETATVIIDSVSVLVGNVAGDFVFDTDNANGLEHTFTVVGEVYDFIINGESYRVVFDGVGSLKFTLVLAECLFLDGGEANPSSQTETPVDGGSSFDASQTETPIDGGNASSTC